MGYWVDQAHRSGSEWPSDIYFIQKLSNFLAKTIDTSEGKMLNILRRISGCDRSLPVILRLDISVVFRMRWCVGKRRAVF